MKIKRYKGNLFNSPFKIYAHGVNCKGVMGGGIASQIKKRFPNNFTAYLTACSTAHTMDVDLCGGIFVFYEKDKIILNCFTQYRSGSNAEAKYVKDCFEEILQNLHTLDLPESDKKDVIMPLIGCGIGGLDVDTFNNILQELEETYDQDITFHIVTEFIESFEKLQEL